MATLDDVLNGKDEPETQTTAQPAPEPVVADAPVVSGDDAAPPAANVDEKLVPLSAVEAERKGRKDWKEKALRTEGENALLKRQLEEFQRGPRPTASGQPPQGAGLPVVEVPDPFLDPEGFRSAVLENARIERDNERWLDQEEAAVDKHGAEAVEAAYAALAIADKTDPSIAAGFKRQRNPIAAMLNWHKKQLAEAEIGGDPEAYKAKVEKELRAKWEAEQQGQPPAPNQSAAPAPRIPQSLANAPNVGGSRSAPAWTGPTPLDDILRKH